MVPVPAYTSTVCTEWCGSEYVRVAVCRFTMAHAWLPQAGATMTPVSTATVSHRP